MKKIRSVLLLALLAALILPAVCAADIPVITSEDVAYIAFHSGAGGDDGAAGVTPDAPRKSLSQTIPLLPSGGTLVIKNKLYIGTDYTVPALNGPLRITSNYQGVDYTTSAGKAGNGISNNVFKMKAGAYLAFQSDVILDDLILYNEYREHNTIKVTNNSTLVVGAGVNCVPNPAYDTDIYMAIEVQKGSTLILNGGRFKEITGEGTVIDNRTEKIGQVVNPGSETSPGENPVMEGKPAPGVGTDLFCKGVSPEILNGASVVYLADNGGGDGKSAASPLGGLEAAAAALPNGGVAVVCGELHVDEAELSQWEGWIKITSVWDGADYRAQGAKLNFSSDAVNCISLGGDTFFDQIQFDITSKGSRVITANGNALVMGADVACTRSSTAYEWLGITGGSYDNAYAVCDDTRPCSITINGGCWQLIRLGNRGVKTTTVGDVSLVVNGGTIDGSIIACDAAPINGSVYMIFNGGEINSRTVNPGLASNRSDISGNVYLTVNGGTFNGSTIYVSQYEGALIGTESTPETDPAHSRQPGKLWGDATFTINGGTFANGAKFSLGAYSGSAFLNIDTSAFSDTAFLRETGFTVSVAGHVSAPTVRPDIDSDYGYAVGLFSLGLAKGYDTTGTNFALKDKMTRVQTIVQVIRLLGKEQEALDKNASHPFRDVPAWASPYVGYAYAAGITEGRSATEFDPDGETSAAQFVTFLLRAIGYSERADGFEWNNPFAFAKGIGMLSVDSACPAFDRGDALEITWNTLYAIAKNGNQVYQNLILSKAFTAEALADAAKKALAAKEADTKTPIKDIFTEEDGYYVISAAEYRDKTTAGYLSQIIGFLSDYKYVWNKDGSPRIAMPDGWWLGICHGNDAQANPFHAKIVKSFYNSSTQMWDLWIADAFSIDTLSQHILSDMYAEYGTVVTKVITDGWADKYKPWDMGGGQRFAGAYYLASTYRYVAPFLGNGEYGNKYPWAQEPWIGNDGLGMSAAGMPNVALDLSKTFARVTGNSDNVLWTDFVVTMSSMAYFEKDIPSLIRKAAEIFPADSYERYVVDTVFEIYEQVPNSFRRALILAEKQCARDFYYLNIGASTNEQGRVEVNFAFMLVALLYGEGDYTETAKILSLCGYDTRGTIMLPILGIIGGLDAIPEYARALTWQDGKGEIINKAIPNTTNGVWMFAEGLPERYKISDVIDLYCENYEKILIEAGGKVENGMYYIPKQKLRVGDSVAIRNYDFESGLDGYTAFGERGAVKASSTVMYGKGAVEISTSATAQNGIYTAISGLTVGRTYRLSGWILANMKTTAHLFAREVGSEAYVYASVFNQSGYVNRELVFTATADTMEIGMLLPAQADPGTAYLDQLSLVRIEEKKLGAVEIASDGDGTGTYTGKINLTVSGKQKKEVYLKVAFANTTGGVVNAAITVNGDSFNTVPFCKTGLADYGKPNDCVYIPVYLGETQNQVTIDIGRKLLRIDSVECVDVNDRALTK